MAHQITITLTEQEYAELIAEAAKHGQQPEIFLHDMVQQLEPVPEEKRPLTDDEFMEKLYREGDILNIPTRRQLTPEELAERERFIQRLTGGKPASEMIIEDRGPY